MTTLNKRLAIAASLSLSLSVLAACAAPVTPAPDASAAPSTPGTFTLTEGQALNLRFKAQVGDEALVCSQASGPSGTDKVYAGVGADVPNTSRVRPFDFRFFVHDVELLRAAGSPVPLSLAQGTDGWQYQNVALLDFESSATAGLNDQVTGTAAAGTYTGLRFKLGVPHALNQPEQAPHAILDQGGRGAGMNWSWLGGWKFAKFEFGVAEPGSDTEKKFVLHLGATGATGDTPETRVFSAPNVVSVTLDGFNPTSEVVVADLKSLLANVRVKDGGSFMPKPMAHDTPATEPEAHNTVATEAHGTVAIEVEPANDTEVFLQNMGLVGAGEQRLFRVGR